MNDLPKLKQGLALRLLSGGLFYIMAMEKSKPNTYTTDLNDRSPGFELEYKAISGKFVQNASNIGICEQMLTLLVI